MKFTPTLEWSRGQLSYVLSMLINLCGISCRFVPKSVHFSALNEKSCLLCIIWSTSCWSQILCGFFSAHFDCVWHVAEVPLLRCGATPLCAKAWVSEYGDKFEPVWKTNFKILSFPRKPAGQKSSSHGQKQHMCDVLRTMRILSQIWIMKHKCGPPDQNPGNFMHFCSCWIDTASWTSSWNVSGCWPNLSETPMAILQEMRNIGVTWCFENQLHEPPPMKLAMGRHIFVPIAVMSARKIDSRRYATRRCQLRAPLSKR